MTHPQTPLSDALGPRLRALTQIERLIANGELLAGYPLPTEEVLAARLNLSRPTVHRAVCELIARGTVVVHGPRRRVIAGERGATPLGHLPVLQGTVLILTDGPFGMAAKDHQAAGWEDHLYAGLHEALQAQRWHLLAIRAGDLAAVEITNLVRARPRGLVVLRDAARIDAGADLLRAFIAAGIPAVAFGNDFEYPLCDTLTSDQCAGGAALVTQLAARGRTRLQRCWLLDRSTATGVGWLQERNRGHEQACRMSGLAVLPPLVWHDHSISAGEDGFSERARLAAGTLAPLLLGANPPDVLLATSDGNVPVLAAACRILGRDPHRDLDLIGYDHYWADIPERRWEPTPPLASVDKRNRELGAGLAGLLRRRLEGELPPTPQHESLEPRLVWS